MRNRWIHDTIRSRLVVRIDLVRAGNGGYRSMHAHIVGCAEDEDGLDPFHFVHEIDLYEKRQFTRLEWRWLPMWGDGTERSYNEERYLFLDVARSCWDEEWEVEIPILVRSRSYSFRDGYTEWRVEPMGSEVRLIALMNLQGVVNAQVSLPRNIHKEPFDGTFAGNWSLGRLVERVQGLVSEELGAYANTFKRR